MKAYIPLLTALGLLLIAGCYERAQAQTRPLDKSSLFDRWEAMQMAVLLENAKSLEANYLRLKAEPSMRPDGKPAVVTPESSLHFGGFGMGFRNAPVTPAMNAFAPHIGGDAMVGNVPIEVARLRVFLDETKTSASWVLYRMALANNRPVERYFDRVGQVPLDEDGRKVVRDEVLASIKAGGEPRVGKVAMATFDIRPLRLFDKTCITCHTKNQVGDVVGVMLYMAAGQ